MQTIPYPTPDGIIDLVRKTEYDALFQSLCKAEELIREIRDNEINAQNEATKFLRDHQSSELSKLRADNAKLEAEIAASNASSENELLQMVQADNIQLLQQNKRLIDARNKLRADNAELIDRLREARESHLHASARDVQTIQQQAVELAKWQALAGQLAEALTFWDVNHPALAAYEAAKTGSLPDPLAEAVKRMESVSLDEMCNGFAAMDLGGATLGEMIEAVRARLIQAAMDHAETPASTATRQ